MSSKMDATKTADARKIEKNTLEAVPFLNSETLIAIKGRRSPINANRR